MAGVKKTSLILVLVTLSRPAGCFRPHIVPQSSLQVDFSVRRRIAPLLAGNNDSDGPREVEEDPEEAERIRLFREKMMGRFGGRSVGGEPSMSVPGMDASSGEKTPRQLRKEAREQRRRSEGAESTGTAKGGETFMLKQFASAEELAAMEAAESSTEAGEKEGLPWSRTVEHKDVGPGTLLLGNPNVFTDPKCPQVLLKRCGLAQHIPAGDMDPDRCADVLPAILIVEGTASGAGTVGGECIGLFLNRRTGYLLGDLERDTTGFLIQPLNLGGTGGSSELSFLHPYPEIRDALRVTDDELFYGGSFDDAQLLVKKGTGSQFSFRFFVQQTVWKRGDLQRELNDGVWLPAACSKDIILKIREREGSRRPKPLWTDVMELVGGDYGDIVKDLYERQS